MERDVFTGSQQVNNINVYYEFYPHQTSEKTLVLLHGFLSSTFTFRHLISLLKKEYQVLSIDLPPFGKSAKCNHYVYSYKNLAQTVINLTESLGLKKMTFIGHSMGGQIVLNILHMMPELADKAILLCSSAYLKRFKLPLIISSYIPYFHLFVKYKFARMGVKKNLQETLYNHSIINDEMINGYLEPFLQDEIFVALTRMIRDREGDLPAYILRQIKTPCLLLWGDHDKSMPLKVGEQLNKDLSNSELIILKESGHALPEERPNEVFEYIKNFIGTFKTAADS
ncbi:alpha/beta hydrolase [Neobacillus sp. MM2021_6]|uniref:alpha/beta fold hydrolase n=1 Tax=Bacillaceae TaxID=186817 RepID=UPI00140A1E32|nr:MULTISPECIES: alpha/beta hydrolase [Bacillaceae]MBO0960428.1 alpha/beta hydrolase [Neobacillus sp. MM2021_6]NHC16715.1 alpha/beta hydrolase [Bacillus sp. MM2020_4]